MDSKSKLVGRKLYLKWGEHMYVAIEKIPAGDKNFLKWKCLEIQTSCSATCMRTQTANFQRRFLVNQPIQGLVIG